MTEGEKKPTLSLPLTEMHLAAYIPPLIPTAARDKASENSNLFAHFLKSTQDAHLD